MHPVYRPKTVRMVCCMVPLNVAILLTKPEVGSSRNRMEGSAISSRPILTRFFSPPETPRRRISPTGLLATRDRPRFARVSSARSSIISSGVPLGSLNRPAKIKFSRTVSSA
jgi:hypothetical protein